MKLPNFLKTVS